MKNLITVLMLLFISNLSFSQPPCLPAPHGIAGADERPGCKLCDFVYVGNTGGFTPDTIGFDFPCGTIIGNQWFTVVPDSTEINMNILNSNCINGGAGLQAIFYDLNMNVVSNCYSVGGIGFPGNIIAQDLTPGENYYLMIDRYLEDGSCDFYITIWGLIGYSGLKAEPIYSVPDQNIFCTPNQACYSIPPVDGATDYVWSVPSKANILEGGGLRDTFVCVEYLFEEDGQIMVIPYQDCLKGGRAEYPVYIDSKSSNISTIICPGETFEAGSEVFDSAGLFSVVVENVEPFDCDSTIHLEIKIPDTSAVIVECVRDSFLQAIGIDWTKKSLAEQYQIFINDSLVSAQSFTGFLYHPNFSNEEINIEVKPFGTHGCDYASAKTTCTGPILTSSVNVFEKEVISVFPNPSSGVFEVYSKEKVEKVEVFNFSGKEVKAVSDVEIDLSEFESGVYFLKIYFGDEVILKKVIKL